MVFSGLSTAWRRAICPTNRSPVLVKATTDGVRRLPSLLMTTVGLPPSITATTELVVPKSMPTAFPINFSNAVGQTVRLPRLAKSVSEVLNGPPVCSGSQNKSIAGAGTNRWFAQAPTMGLLPGQGQTNSLPCISMNRRGVAHVRRFPARGSQGAQLERERDHHHACGESVSPDYPHDRERASQRERHE